MASAFTRLFSSSHRKRTSTASSSRRHESRFPTSSTFDLRHSIPEESSSAAEPSFPSSASPTKLTVQQLNDHVSAPISDATLRRRSLANDACRSNDAQRPSLPRSFSALDITSPLNLGVAAHQNITSELDETTVQPPADDEDDFESNPLYLNLSEDPRLATDWTTASLALIPLARTLTSRDAVHPDDLHDPHFVALHAFAPSRLYKDQFVSIRSLVHASASLPDAPVRQHGYDWGHVTLTAAIHSDQRSITVTETTHASRASSETAYPPSGSGSQPLPATSTAKRQVAIVAETTIYRTLPTPERPTISNHQSGFQVTSRIQSSSSDTPAPSAKVRVITVDLPIVRRRTHAAPIESSHAVLSTSDPAADDQTISISDLILEHVPPRRRFATDLSFLANPSVASPRLAESLINAFHVLFTAAHQFIASFIYVRGFESYNAHRIRRGIWFKAWKAFEERLGSEHIARLSVEAFHRIKSLLENVVMGLVHTKMYGPIQDQLLDADLVTDDVLGAYNAFNVTLADFGVHNVALRQRPGSLDAAIDILNQGLRDESGPELDDALSAGDLTLFNAFVGQSQDEAVLTQSSSLDRLQTDLGLAESPHHRTDLATASSDVHRRTPLQILQTLRATIDEIGWAAERVHVASSRRTSSSHERPPPLGTDDLLPILSYVFMRARADRLCSMLYYARVFQLTDTATSPELQWALVTCDAVIAYLRTDPLRLCRRRSSGSIPAESLRKGSQSQSLSINNNDGLSVRSMSSRSHQGSTGASTLNATTPLVRGSSANETSANADAASLHSPRSSSPLVDASSDRISVNEANSYFYRHGDVSLEHLAYAASDASPRLYAEGFKLPGLPASVSSRRNSRILGQRPPSVFSLSEDGDAISLLPDTSLDALEPRPSLSAASPSPSRPLKSRNRTFSSSSNSTTHNDVQIRPQIVRTIKRSQTGNLYTANRLERTSSNGSATSSGQIHVRVVGSPSMQMADANTGRDPALVNASPPKTDRSDRRRSFDSWTAFSLFSSNAVPSATNTLGRASLDASNLPHSAMSSAIKAQSEGHGIESLHTNNVSRGSFSSAGTGGSSGFLYWRTEADSVNRHNSVSKDHAKTASSGAESFGASAAKTLAAEWNDVNCRPEGVETPQLILQHSRSQRPASTRSNSAGISVPQRPPASELTHTGSLSSRPSQRRYRGRFLSTSSATLAVSATPLPPQVDRSSTSTASLARPARAHRQSIGSLHALRASMVSPGTQTPPLVPTTETSEVEAVPEMIPYGGPTVGREAEDVIPAPLTAVRDPLLDVTNALVASPAEASTLLDATPSKAPQSRAGEGSKTDTLENDDENLIELAGQV
ncbi:VPS9 domain-containing protein [Pseudozyma hubeiensis]|nr:VPS9 domain-containing protein [Pseudozyma hubeiensis]